jgi:hypothetical protein
MFAISLLIVLLSCSIVSTTSESTVNSNSSIGRLSLTRRLNVTSINLLNHDRARVKTLLERVGGQVLSAASTTSTVGNEPVKYDVVGYFASIGVGNPPTFCEHLMIKCILTTS